MADTSGSRLGGPAAPEVVAFQAGGQRRVAEIVCRRPAELDPEHGLTHQLRFAEGHAGTQWVRLDEGRRLLSSPGSWTDEPYDLQDGSVTAPSGKPSPVPPECSWRVSNDSATHAYSASHLTGTALTQEYLRQEALRAWDSLLSHLESTVGTLAGKRIYDFGCGAGAVSSRLAARADVTGVDLDPQMVACAKLRCPGAQFRVADLGHPRRTPGPWPPADGIWSSYVAAYFPGDRLEAAIAEWAALLKPGGWLCLVEIDGLFSAHAPLGTWAEGFADVDRELPSYDAFAGRRLAAACAACGLVVREESEWQDRELCFQGAAGEEQVSAWRSRLSRPAIRKIISQVFGDAADGACEAFLECLRSPDHEAQRRIKMVIGCKQG